MSKEQVRRRVSGVTVQPGKLVALMTVVSLVFYIYWNMATFCRIVNIGVRYSAVDLVAVAGWAPGYQDAALGVLGLFAHGLVYVIGARSVQNVHRAWRWMAYLLLAFSLVYYWILGVWWVGLVMVGLFFFAQRYSTWFTWFEDKRVGTETESELSDDALAHGYSMLALRVFVVGLCAGLFVSSVLGLTGGVLERPVVLWPDLGEVRVVRADGRGVYFVGDDGRLQWRARGMVTWVRRADSDAPP